LHSVNYKDSWVDVVTGEGKTSVFVKRGEVLFGRKTWSKKLDIPQSTLDRWMKKLEMYKIIVRKPGTHYTIVTICNYDVSKDNNIRNRTGTDTGTDTGTGQALDTDKEDKREREEEKENIQKKNEEPINGNPVTLSDNPVEQARIRAKKKAEAEKKRLKAEKKKREEAEIEERFQECLAAYNAIVGRNITQSGSLMKRVKEGVTKEQVEYVTRLKLEEWKNDSHMRKFTYRPETLFSDSKFYGYLETEMPDSQGVPKDFWMTVNT